MFGRAFIWPDRYFFSKESGWITTAGLRAAPLSNVRGVLLGEAITASRDSAKPLATMDAIASWATRQAGMIADAVKDEERQARSAEVVLECGGQIKDLKIVQWRPDWLSQSEFERKIRCAVELTMSFDGEFDYDEEQDDVHPREFRDDFSVCGDIVAVPTYDGSILKVGNVRWPRLLERRQRAHYSNVADYVRATIVRLQWNNSDRQ